MLHGREPGIIRGTGTLSVPDNQNVPHAGGFDVRFPGERSRGNSRAAASESVMDDEQLSEIVKKHFDLRPAAIIRDLDLRKPIYKQVAAYGHFGRTDLDLPWERLNKVDELKAELK